MPRIDELRAWERELKAEHDALGRELEPLIARRQQVAQKLELVQRLIAVERDPAFPETAPPADASSPSSPPRANGNQIQTAVHAILQENGRPMHIRDIHAALIERGVPIPGKGTEANVIVHLRRAPDTFARRNRGVYGLKRTRNGKEATN
jgi:hypothetical protein